MATIQYLIEESSYEDGPEGESAVDVFLVTGLKGSVSSRARRAAQHSGIPRKGSQHPSGGSLFVRSIGVRAIDTNTFKIFVSYEADADESGLGEDGAVEGWTILNEKETTFDSAGDFLLTSYQYPEGDENGREGKVEVQSGVVTIPEAALGLRFTRREANDQFSLYRDLSIAGKVNRFAWNGFNPRTALYLGKRFSVAAVTENTIFWLVSYEFQVADHRRFITFKDPEKNEIPADLIPGVGYKFAETIPDTDFSALQLGIF